MAGYNRDKDKVIWESERSEHGLIVRVMKYGDRGEPKIAFVRQYEEPDGEIKEKTNYRLNIDDINFFGLVWPQALKVMKNTNSKNESDLPYPDEVDPDKLLSEQGLSVYDNEE